MNLPIPQKAVLKPIIASSGSGIMALWLFDSVVYGYAWPTGKLDRLFLGPNMFTLTANGEELDPSGLIWLNNEGAVTPESYITGPVIFELPADFTVLPATEVRVDVLSSDSGITGNYATFELEELSMADLVSVQKLIPIHRVFIDEMKDHIYVTSEAELQAILNNTALRASYEGVAFYAISAGRED